MSVLLGRGLPSVPESELYRTILAGYSPAVLRSMCHQLDLGVRSRSTVPLAAAIEKHLSGPGRGDALIDFPKECCAALSVLPHIPNSGWRVDVMRQLVQLLGCAEPDRALRVLLCRGLLAVHHHSWWPRVPKDLQRGLEGADGDHATLVPHPGLVSLPAPPIAPPTQGVTRKVRRVRESDGYELLLRAAILWQRIAKAPMRLTQQETPYKRDWERLQSDAVLGAPLFDELVPIRDVPHMALVVARDLGLVVSDAAGGGRLRASLPDLWQEELPMIQRKACAALLAARTWDEAAKHSDTGNGSVHLPARRWGILLLLSGMEPEEWIELGALARELSARERDWGRWMLSDQPPLDVPIGRWASSPRTQPRANASGWLESFLLGLMYQAGVVQVAQGGVAGTRVVRLSRLGRWMLRCGELPQRQQARLEKTLFVQPNHEVVLYRQGLTPELLGQLASFCRWKAVGPALTLELTPESVYHGLELGRTGEEMIAILERHSGRPLPVAVKDSVRTWAQRRQRLSLYDRCTVLEFRSRDEMQQALAQGIDGVALNERMLLLTDMRAIPFEELRLSGSRDYRQRPASCVRVSEDGTGLELDLAGSDLLVQCELPRFAESAGGERSGGRVRYRITPGSLASAAQGGLGDAFLRNWFRQRAGVELPPSVELMLQASRGGSIVVSPLLVVQTPSASVADGLLQHPGTRPYIHSRLGPTALSVPPRAVAALKKTLRRLGLELRSETTG